MTVADFFYIEIEYKLRESNTMAEVLVKQGLRNLAELLVRI